MRSGCCGKLAALEGSFVSLFGKGRDEGESVSGTDASQPPRTDAPPSQSGRERDGGSDKVANI